VPPPVPGPAPYSPPPPVAPYAAPPASGGGNSNGMAVAALVLGILTFVCLGPIAGVLAIVFGILGMKKAKETGVGKGMSIAGIVLGAVGTVLTIVLFFVFVIAADNVSNSIDDAFGKADPADYDITTDTCKVDQYGFVEFDGTIKNTASKDMNFTINTEIRESGSNVLLDSPSTYVTVNENDTVKWSVSSSLDSATNIECKVDSVNDFFN
jgi:hypothetical protein